MKLFSSNTSGSLKRLFTVLVCLLTLHLVAPVAKSYGQNNYVPPHAPYMPPTPAATQFEKYINYPVDHSTGAASVNVPLHTLKAGSIKVPITLSYHTAGVKPSDPSLPVGLGWVVNPGARVTRNIVKYADEMFDKPPFSGSANTYVEASNLEYSPYGSWPSSNRYTIWDGEYDIFTYYTPTGATGRFIIKKEGNEYVAVPLIVTRDKIKVHVTTVAPTRIDYIEITDANGVFHRFGLGITPYSASPGSTAQETVELPGTPTTGWALTDMISADGADTVSFTWKNIRNDDVNNWYRKRVLTDKAIITDSLIFYFSPGTATAQEYYGIGYYDTDFVYPDVFASYYIMSALAGIKYKDQEVKMNFTSTVPTVLTSMEIHSQGVKQHQVDFQTSNFSNNLHKRLDAVTFKDKNGSLINKYQFSYNEQVALPGETSRAIDFWGYYNGYESNTSIVPNFPYSIWRPWLNGSYNTVIQAYNLSTGTDRSSNINATAFILNSVTYPTGGKTTYEYEVNQIFDPYTSQVVNTGGLRVKKISHWAVDGQLAETRSYVYGINGSGYGDGVRMSANMFVEETRVFNYYADVYRAVFRKRVFQGTPVNNLMWGEVAPATYQEVTEYIGNQTGNNSGKIVYRYLPARLPQHSPWAPNTTYQYAGHYWDKPVLLGTTTYKNDGSTYKIVSRTSTRYVNYEPSSTEGVVVRRFAEVTSLDPALPPKTLEANLELAFQGVSLGTGVGIFQQFPVHLYTGIRVPEITRSVEYTASGDSMVVEQSFVYENNDYLYPYSVTTTNSNGNSTTTYYKYPKDYNVGNSPTNPVAQGIKLLKDRNVVAPVIEEYTRVQPGNVIRSGKFTTYKADKPLPEHVYSLNAIASGGSFTPASITDSAHSKSNSFLLRSTVDLYDTYGNIRQATDNTGGISTVVLYSYSGRFPVAIIKNATYAAVSAVISGGDAAINNFASGNPNNAAVNSFLANLRTSLPQAYITTYTHDPFLGITSQTDENGRTTTYQYDAVGRLQLIKDKDGNVVQTFDYKYKQ